MPRWTVIKPKEDGGGWDEDEDVDFDVSEGGSF
jgi:hypothetical protein